MDHALAGGLVQLAAGGAQRGLGLRHIPSVRRLAEPVSYTHLTLPAVPQAVRLARQATRDALAVWQLGQLAETAVLLVSELVTNAIRHAVDTGAIGLELTSADTWLRLEVQDGDPHWRQMECLDDCDESGYGFVLVDSLADRWGVRRICAGKAVWAELDAS